MQQQASATYSNYELVDFGVPLQLKAPSSWKIAFRTQENVRESSTQAICLADFYRTYVFYNR